MRSKEEILDACMNESSGYSFDEYFLNESADNIKQADELIKSDVLDAMNQYAQEVAIEFAKFIQINDIEYDFGEQSWWWNKRSLWLSDEQLFGQFLKETNNA